MSKLDTNIHAVIDIGSNLTTLKICQNISGKLRVLEYAQAPLFIGRETFFEGNVSFKTSMKLCNILTRFTNIIDVYEVSKPDIVATTAIREATNNEYVLEQVKNRTGIKINVLDDLEEKTIIYNELLRNELTLPKDNKLNGLMVYVGTGSLGIAHIKDNHIVYNQNIKIGSLKLSEILEPVQGYTHRFHSIVEQYISTFIDTIDNVANISKIKEFIAAGKELHVITSLMETNKKENLRHIITTKEFENFYDGIKQMTPRQISDEFDISYERSEIVIPFFALFKLLTGLTRAKKIIARHDTLCDALIYRKLYSDKFKKWNVKFNKNIIQQAKKIASRFSYDNAHADRVLYNTLCLFDSLYDLHKLSTYERLLLQVACILHDIGKYINIKNHNIHSYNIIKNLDILGLSGRDLELIAIICFYHSERIPALGDNYTRLTKHERITVSKLISLIRLGDALDKSHTQKFDKIRAFIKDEVLTVICQTTKDSLLEEWSFRYKSEFFRQVFGIDAQLYIERKI